MEDIPKEMVCLQKTTASKGYQCMKIQTPFPVNDEVLIKIKKVAICGSDINLYMWNETAKVIAALPFIPGHEATGIVVRKGPDVKNLNVGDRIAVENHFFCGKCFQCKEDRGDICASLNQYGHGKGTIHGGCCEYSVVSEKYCYRLQYGISDVAAVLLEPMGVAHNAIERLEVDGEAVLVIGCGPVGLFAVSCAKALGATKVFAVDVLEERLDLARKMGANETFNSKEGGSQKVKEEIMKITSGVGIGRICEASGAASMLNGCFSYLRKGGRITLVGLPKKPLHVENVLQDILFKSLNLNTVHGRRIFHTWEECEKLIADGKVDPLPVVSHQLPISKFEEAFKALLSGNACKIIMDPQL
ncbi:L-threonine 3-dehydrogenase-like isoform X1 [Clavelina lepadiformis]|uniref:L-threonine 3-dehydrogenase-like isoform X1 n=2 Tax=Clavelina lepadiformis TaxID=159417 RepID=UPI004040F458